MDDLQIPCLAFGSVVAAAGIAMVVFNVRAHRRHLADEELTDSDLEFFTRQYSRRIQTSALTVLFGGVIGLWGVFNVREFPVLATLYLIGMLVLAAWLVLLALSDVLATRIYAGKLDRKHRRVCDSLQDALDQVREAHGLERSTSTDV